MAGGLFALNAGQKIKLAAGVIGLVVLLTLAVLWGHQPEWRVLYTNLSDKDGGAVVAQLSQMNVPYKYSDGGNALLVPAERVHDVRLRLATQGLPKGSVIGFELLDNSHFGITQFQERLNFQRGLEGELTRSIQALASVQGARVHLALPNQNGFIREQLKPSASVLLTLHAGRSLDRSQIAGIVHLIASSVPDMSPKAVSVLDDSGALLSDAQDSNGGVVDAQQLQYLQQVEQSYNRRILDMLEPVVGRANVRAQVSADIDFSQSESTSEQHRPNQGSEPGAVRSQQISEIAASGAGAAVAGIPGASSNQPQVAATLPVNGAAPPLQAGSGTSSASGSGNRRESVVNYEVDKTVKVVRNASGTIKRLSAAVVLNDRQVTDAAGKVTQVAMSPEQIAQMTALVKETIGFSKERGDSVNVVNAAFNRENTVVAEVPLWRQPELVDMARASLWPIGIALTSLIVLLGLVRPALKSMKSGRNALPGTHLNAMIDGADVRPGLSPPAANPLDAFPQTVEAVRLADAKQLALAKPMAVANIVKTWVHGENPS